MTHGVPGLEYVNNLKTINDARELKGKINKSIELASLTKTSEKDRSKLLSFVVCGGGISYLCYILGPTGKI